MLDQAPLNPALGASGNRLLLATARRLAVAGTEPCPTLRRDYAQAFGARAMAAHNGALAFLTVAAQAAGRRLDVAPPGWSELTADEARLLALLTAARDAPDPLDDVCDFFVEPAEDEAPTALDRLLAVMSSPGRRRHLRTAAQAVAGEFTAFGLSLAVPPLPRRPALTLIAGGWTGVEARGYRPPPRLRLVPRPAPGQPVAHPIGADDGAAEAGLQQITARRGFPIQHFPTGEHAG